MKKIFTILAIILGTAVAAHARTETFRLKVGPFDKLAVYDNIHVVYHANPDSTGYVVYRADEGLADAILFSNVKGTLKIQIANENVPISELPELHVYSDYLTQVENSSDYTVKVLSNTSVPRFTARMMGNGEIIADNIKAGEVEANFVTGNGIIALSGICEKAVYKMVGAGTIQADEMKAKNVNCKIIGAGSIGCWVNDKLDVRGIGSTKIYYKGTPQVKKVGGGKLVPLDLKDKGDENLEIAQHHN